MLIKEHKLSLCDVENSKYVIHYDFIEVTENAAAKGVFYVMAGDNKSAEVKFKLSEGRWNDFDVLMKENIKKYFTRVDQELSSDPYINCKLYKNK